MLGTACHALPASWGRLQSDVKAKHPLFSASRVRFGDPIPVSTLPSFSSLQLVIALLKFVQRWSF